MLPPQDIVEILINNIDRFARQLVFHRVFDYPRLSLMWENVFKTNFRQELFQNAEIEIFLILILNIKIHFVELLEEGALSLPVRIRELRGAFLLSDHGYLLYGRSTWQ